MRTVLLDAVWNACNYTSALRRDRMLFKTWETHPIAIELQPPLAALGTHSLCLYLRTEYCTEYRLSQPEIFTRWLSGRFGLALPCSLSSIPCLHTRR